MKLTTVRCDTCGIVCTNKTFEYCGMDLCESCLIERKEREKKTHTASLGIAL